MKPNSSERTQVKVNVRVRDALRGIRYAVRKSGHFLGDQSHQVLPDPINDLAYRAVRKLDRLSDEIERVTSSLGGPFQKSSSPDSTFFSTRWNRSQVAETESEEAARALYFGLNYAFRSFHNSAVLISESLCLDCILDLEKTSELSKPETLASQLYTCILSKRVFRSDPSELADDDKFNQSVSAACFAAAMWFFLSRDAESVDEQSLLDTCCEVSEYNLQEIVALKPYPRNSEPLFQYLLDIIGETGKTHSGRTGMVSATSVPINKSARRLRWFMSAFDDQVDQVSRRTGVTFEVDKSCLRRVFLNWVSRFERQKPHEDPIQQFYITYPAAIMLQELIMNKPLTAVASPQNADADKPFYYWPEGYVYVLLCINVRSAVIEELLDVKTDKGARFNNIDIWCSFKENVHQDPATTMGFFQLFVDEEPQWDGSSRFDVNNAVVNAQKLYLNAAKQVEKAE